MARGTLTYFSSQNIPAGHIVTVPFRNKKILALVLAAEDLRQAKGDVKGMNFNLKKIAADRGGSAFSREFLESAVEVSQYFALGRNSAIAFLLPNVFLEAYDKFAQVAGEQTELASTAANNLRSEKLLFQYPLPDRISIYKTSVREAFARGQSIFLVLPTEADIAKFSTLLGKGIEQFTFTFHSNFSAKKNIKNLEKLAAALHPVLILGTPPFLAIPYKNIGTIILEHESSSAHRTIVRPVLDLRVFVEIYAVKIGAKFILADDLLRFETIERATRDHLHTLHPLSFRIDFPGIIEINERRKKEASGGFKIFTEECLREIKSVLEAGKNVFVFSLRKGLATLTVCRDCGDTLACENCTAPLVLYLAAQSKKRMFVCNRCERNWGADKKCARCDSWNLMPLGIGTDIVYEEIKKALPKTKVFKLDKESAKSASGAKKIIGEFQSEKGAVLIGTEMAFFYLKDKVPLTVVASFDSLWSIPNYKMSEKVLQVTLKLAELTEDKIIIQTKNAESPSIRAIKSGNLLQFVREELDDRQKLGYPPFARFIKISHLGNKEETHKARKFLEEFLTSYSPEIFSGFVARLKGKYVTNALIRVEPKNWSLPALSPNSEIDQNLYQKLTSLPPQFEVAVDPEDLL